MAIVTDQAFAGNFDPGVPPTLPSAVTVISITINDANDDGLITSNGLDQVNGSNVTVVYNGDTVTIDGVQITGATIYTADGGRYFTPTDGTILEPGTVTNTGFVTDNTQLTLPELAPPCFVEKIHITTIIGHKRVETLAVGDLVLTKDHGFQPIRWIGHGTVRGRDNFAPICFDKGTIGNSEKLWVSPQHRILISGWKCELLFGEAEVLCAAKHLCQNDDRIYVDPCDKVTYYHIMFEQHEIVFAEGAETESFFVGDQVTRSNRETYNELIALFPELEINDTSNNQSTARHCIKKHEYKCLSGSVY